MPRVQRRLSYATFLQKSYPDSYAMTDTQRWHSLFDPERTRVPITRIRFPLRLSHGRIWSSLPQAPTFMFPLQRLFSATNALLFCPFPRAPGLVFARSPRYVASVNALTAVGALMALIDFTLSNARRFYSSMGNPLAVKGLIPVQAQPLFFLFYQGRL